MGEEDGGEELIFGAVAVAVAAAVAVALVVKDDITECDAAAGRRRGGLVVVG